MDKTYKIYKLQSELNSKEKIEKISDKANRQAYLDGFDFSILMQNLLVSPTGYVMDTGNWENANREIALSLLERIKKHPIIWKLLYMVA